MRKPDRSGPPPLKEPAPLLAALGAVMVGDLTQFLPGLTASTDERARVVADDLLGGEMARAILQRFDDQVADPDPRAVVSVWSLSYFTTAMPPLIAANILLDRSPELQLDRVSFVMAQDLRFQSLVVTGEAAMKLPPGIERFRSLVDGHLAAIIGLIASRSDVSPRVLWSNAGHVFEAFLGMIAAAAAERPGLADARALIAAPVWPTGERNPLHRAVHYVGGKRIRRVCCLRFLVPQWRVCGICPLTPDSPARLRAAA